MKSESVTVSKRGYIVLPAHIRKEMDIKPGTKILINRTRTSSFWRPYHPLPKN